MESVVHPADFMLALKNSYLVLALGIVACSASSSTRTPFAAEENNSEKVPAFRDSDRDEPAPAAEPPDENTVAPTTVSKPSSAPPPECPAEAEPNNDPDKASAFTRCITGELTSWTDNDYLLITAPKNVTDMIIDHVETGGAIQYAISTPQNGGAGGSSSFSMSFTDEAPKTKITPGQDYLFSLKWDNNGQGKVSDKRPYMVRVTFE